MNLIVDIGNTRAKLAVFKQQHIDFQCSVSISDCIDEIKRINLQYKDINYAIISSVSKLQESDIAALQVLFKVIVLDEMLKLPFNNLYATPKTLGVDRIGLVSAAVHRYPNQNCLIIDAGTCITFDLVTAEGNYLGGAISPGLLMRYKALHTFTAKLPLLELQAPDNITGNSTQSSIHSGVVLGTLYEIDGIIAHYFEKYKNLTVILTGGDCNFLAKQLKSSIFVNSNFLLEGLNTLLEFNIKE